VIGIPFIIVLRAIFYNKSIFHTIEDMGASGLNVHLVAFSDRVFRSVARIHIDADAAHDAADHVKGLIL